MPRFLIDENLPYYFELWNSDKFVHVHDLTGMKTDAQIWEYSRINDLTIVSKDSDFSNRIISKTPPPKVIHIRCGNIRIQELHRVLTSMWPQIESEILNHKLVNVYLDRIESIS
jgi:predicted nuclease of predicted toxin-antitoxin system